MSPRTLARKTAVTGILGALALTLSFLERFLLSALPLPPGVKPGLSNVAVLFAVSALGLPYAAGLVLLKAGFSLLVSGIPAALMSLCGGLCSTLAMYGLCRLQKKGLSYIGISVVSAVLHNAGQLGAASVLVGSGLYLSYAPVLLVSGLVFGTVTGLLLRAVLPALGALQIKITQKQSDRERG